MFLKHQPIHIFLGEENTGGMSVTFGCSWQNTNDGCKWSANGDKQNVEKFSLDGASREEEESLALNLEMIATMVAPILKKVAPIAYKNMTNHEEDGR